MFKGFVYTPNDCTLELLGNSLLMAQRKYLYSISSEKPGAHPALHSRVSLSGWWVTSLNIFISGLGHTLPSRAWAEETTPANRHICGIQNPSDVSRQWRPTAHIPPPHCFLLDRLTNDSFSWVVRCAPQKGACCKAWPLGG